MKKLTHYRIYLLLIFSVNYLIYGTLSAILTDEERLIKELFVDYNPTARPVINNKKTVVIDIQYSLQQIKQLDSRSQTLTSIGHLVLRWKDERLVWNASEENVPDELVINSKHIWTPEFATINGVDKLMDDYSTFTTILRPDGSVRWDPGHTFKTMCDLDITEYPFDVQKCDLIFGAWSLHTTKMNMTSNMTKINMDSYDENGEWDIMDTHAVRNEFWFACCPNQRFSNMQFTVTMRRRHTYYILNVILPGILTSVILLLIFFATIPTKMHIGIVSLLSFRLFLNSVTNTIPHTSVHVPLLCVYLTCSMTVTTLVLLSTVFVLNLHSIKDRPVPKWAKQLIIVHAARVMCMNDSTGLPSGIQRVLDWAREKTDRYIFNNRDPGEEYEDENQANTNQVDRRRSWRCTCGATHYCETEIWNDKRDPSRTTTVALSNHNEHSSGLNQLSNQNLHLHRNMDPGKKNGRCLNHTTGLGPKIKNNNEQAASLDRSAIHREKTMNGDRFLSFNSAYNIQSNETARYDHEISQLQMRSKSESNVARRQSGARLSLTLEGHTIIEETKVDTTTKPPNYSKEWVKVANVIDRLFLVLMAICITAITCVLFQPTFNKK